MKSFQFKISCTGTHQMFLVQQPISHREQKWMKWQSIKIGQAHKDFVPSRLQAPCCWSAFQAGHVSLHSKTFMEGSKAWGCSCASHSKGAVMPPALSPEDSYKREVVQGKMWRLTPGENQGMGRKPSRSAEQKEVHFLNWGLLLAGEPAAQPSQHLHSLLGMSLASQRQTTWPFTASAPSPSPLSIAWQTLEVCYLFIPDKGTWYFLTAAFPPWEFGEWAALALLLLQQIMPVIWYTDSDMLHVHLEQAQ